MSNAHPHDISEFILGGDAPAKTDETPRPAVSESGGPPVGYRWVSKRWRVLPDGTRDYAAYHGNTAFSTILPVNSKPPTPDR